MRTRSSEGWGQLPRAIARALAGTDLREYEAKLIWAIVYKTIAFNKIEDRIPQSQFVSLTGIDQRNLSRTINSLLKKGMIFKRGNVYGIQRDFTKWENTSPQVYTEKYISSEKKYIGRDVKNTSPETDSRDLSKRAIQEKGLSPSEKKKKKEIVDRGLKMLKETLKGKGKG
ncbi:unnamed protein product [marine sediment metagenome]|uniref:Bacteriophage lambda Replication protein O N-terminal domain-containing protein n=2 Tax=marine sediment metagenome TaxID=412755 RepID=X1RY65_9ZZZZ